MVTSSFNGQPRASSRSRASRLSYVLDQKHKEATFVERPTLRKNISFSTASTSMSTKASDKSRDEEASQKRRMVIRSKLERFNNPANSESTIVAKKQNLQPENIAPLEKSQKINISTRQRMAYFAELNRRRQTGSARKETETGPKSNPPQDREKRKEKEERQAERSERERIREEASTEEISEKSESIDNDSSTQEESIEDSTSEYDQTKTMASRRETISSRESSLIEKSSSFAAVEKVVKEVQNMSEGERDILLSISGDLFSNEERKGTPKSSSMPHLNPTINRRSSYLEKMVKSRKGKLNVQQTPERNAPGKNLRPKSHSENRRYDKGSFEQDYIEKPKVKQEPIAEVGEDARSQVFNRLNHVQGLQSINFESDDREDQNVVDHEDHALRQSIESKAMNSTFLEDTLKKMNVDDKMLAKILDIEKSQNANSSLFTSPYHSGKKKESPINRKSYGRQSPSPTHRDCMSDMHITSPRTINSSDTVKAAKNIIKWRQMSPRSTRSPHNRDAMILSPSFEKKLNRKYPSFSPPERIYRNPEPDSLTKSYDLSHHSIDSVSGNTMSTKSGNIRRERLCNEVYRPFRPIDGSFYENAPHSAVSSYAATNTGPLQNEIPRYHVPEKEVEARESPHHHHLRSMASIQREEDFEPVQFNKVIHTPRLDRYSTPELPIGHGMPPRISSRKENKNEVLIARQNTNSSGHVPKSFNSVESSIYSSCSKGGIEPTHETLKEGSKVARPIISSSPEDEVQSKSHSNHQNQLESHAGATRTRTRSEDSSYCSTSELPIGHGMPPRISSRQENKNEVLIARQNTNSSGHVPKSFNSVESGIFSSCSTGGVESIDETLKEGSKVARPIISSSPEDEVQSKSHSNHQNQLKSHAGATRTRSEDSSTTTKSSTAWKVIVDRTATKASKFVSMTPSSLTTESLLSSSSTDYSSRSSSSSIVKSYSMNEEPTFSDDSSLLEEKAPTDSGFWAFPSNAIAAFGSFMK